MYSRLRLLITCLFWISPFFLTAQTDTIKLHFLYGSRPAKGYKDTEKKVFGGIKGGHVSIEVDGRVLDFLPGKNPLLPQNSRPTGHFKINPGRYWDTTTSKWAEVHIPVTPLQKNQLLVLFTELSEQTPYDYAILGMRCAAASYHVLSEVGLLKRLRNNQNIFRHFYPKLLRKKIYRWARQNQYPVYFHNGRTSRKWESDKGIF